jgi:aminopeptidase N
MDGSYWLQAMEGRTMLPCFDEISLKANFTVILVTDKDMTSLGNMPVESEVDLTSQGRENKSSDLPEIPNHVSLPLWIFY